MATCRFTHKASERVIKFDSSASRAICSQFGYQESTFQLKNERQDREMKVWDVWASSSANGRGSHIGKLEYLAPRWPGGECSTFPIK